MKSVIMYAYMICYIISKIDIIWKSHYSYFDDAIGGLYIDVQVYANTKRVNKFVKLLFYEYTANTIIINQIVRSIGLEYCEVRNYVHALNYT